MRPAWVSIEGINGVGKTHLAAAVAQRLGARCRPVHELTDQRADALPGRVITALSAAGDTFLRTGHPLTETFALLALKVREHETITAAGDLGAVEVVLEDRGVDTVAVYQGAILAGTGSPRHADALARQLLRLAVQWRPLPDATVLLLEHHDTALERFTRRLGRPLVDAEKDLLGVVAQLYARAATRDPHRFRVLDRAGRSETETVEALVQLCEAAADAVRDQEIRDQEIRDQEIREVPSRCAM